MADFETVRPATFDTGCAYTGHFQFGILKIIKFLAIDDSPGTNRNERVLSSFDAKQNRLQDQVDNLEKQVKSLAPSESAPPLINWRRCAEHHQQRSKSYEEQIAKLYSAVNEQNEIIKKLGMSVFRRFQGIALDMTHTK